jgi:septum formation protein
VSADRLIVLASRSPRRQELFQRLGLPFVVLPADVDETPRPGEPPEVLVARLSAMKAAAVAQAIVAWGNGQPGELPADLRDSLVVAADTVVVLEDEILGKPEDEADAKVMLHRLRGRAHMVHSGVAVVEASSGRAAIQLNSTMVWMRDYSDEEIDAYVATGDPLDKAGAYAIQHAGFQPVERIESCYASVMGMPVDALARGLAHFGVTPPVDVTGVCREWTGQACCREQTRADDV